MHSGDLNHDDDRPFLSDACRSTRQTSSMLRNADVGDVQRGQPWSTVVSNAMRHLVAPVPDATQGHHGGNEARRWETTGVHTVTEGHQGDAVVAEDWIRDSAKRGTDAKQSRAADKADQRVGTRKCNNGTKWDMVQQ